MTVRERTKNSEREKWVAELLRDYPPVRHLEELMGPEPAPEETGEVDAFLQARSEWQLPYSAAKEAR